MLFMGRKRQLRWLAMGLVLCAVLACPSCWKGKPPAKRPIDFVPAGADVLVVLDYRELVRDEFLGRVFDVSEVEKALARIGIQPADIGEIAGFVTIDLSAMMREDRGRSEESPGEFGLIVQGKAGFRPLLESLSQSGWARREYAGKSLWEFEKEGLAAAMLRGNMLVFGSSAGVRSGLDVALGKARGAMQAGAASEGGRILRRIGTIGTINMAISFPREIKMAAKEVSQSAGIFGGMTGANMLRQFFEVLGLGRGIGVSFRGTKTGIATRAVFVTQNAMSAKLVAGLVKAAKILIPTIGAAGEMREAGDIIRGMNVAAENELVLIDFNIPDTILEGFR
jgi:hypothetical protein